MDGVVPSVTVDSRNAAKEVVSPSVVEETVAKEKQSSLVDTTLGSFPPLPTQGTTMASNTLGKYSIDVAVSVEFVRAISERFAKTAYGFFLGKRVAYPVVANYIRNTWGKYRLVQSMFSSSTRLFSFQFSSIDGLDAMLENGLWFIRNNTLILKKWHPDENLMKEDVGSIPVWVKLHVFHITTFNEDGLSAIANKLDEVASVDSDMAKFLAKKDGYGTQSLLEQWKESYENDDYEYDPYDDDMYEGQ
ncbi:hypothetical protein Tco_1030940 [Tanacetum coccineum]|uniref:DUF4283 domain-containing protein n=1 Tax=Tanacetum coccineum TaxID=301880 RepID=A0ABQ5G8D7_9ASTR